MPVPTKIIHGPAMAGVTRMELRVYQVLISRGTVQVAGFGEAYRETFLCTFRPRDFGFSSEEEAFSAVTSVAVREDGALRLLDNAERRIMKITSTRASPGARK